MIIMPSQVKVKNLDGIKSDFLRLKNIKVESNSSKTIFNNELSDDTLNLVLEENSMCTYITFDNGLNENGSNNNMCATLSKDATLKIYNIITSDKNANIKAHIDLNEQGANVEVINLLLLTKNASLDSFIDIYHHVKNTSSDLSNYAIAKDEATITLNNNATIKTKASKSIAHQQTKGLTLSKKTKIKALPNLYIDEYDVVANHACSIGSVSKDDLFYLMSRGLSEAEASKIVVMGYVKPILDHIDDVTIKEEVEKEFAKKLID